MFLSKFLRSSSVNLPVRVRFAPSPTGALHLGGLRTAAFNYLLSKRNPASKFILRIEDTDQSRTVPGASQEIERILKWANINPDASPLNPAEDQPYTQSQNLSLYKAKAEELVSSGQAYREYATDGSFVVRWKDPQIHVSVKDDVLGSLEFPPSKQPDDRILLKSDGWPTYHLASVVDDHRQRITHVLRGQEWIPSLPLHVGLYRAFNYDLPQFAHIPLIADESGKKLSKRDPGGTVQNYIEKGYEPEALLNFIVLLGWSRMSSGAPISEDGYEVLDMDSIAPSFSLSDISIHQARLNPAKLEFLNMKHIERLSATSYGLDRLAEKLKKHVEAQDKHATLETDEWHRSVVLAHATRVRNILDIPAMTPTLFSCNPPDLTSLEAVKLKDKIPEEIYLKTISMALEILIVPGAGKPQLEDLRNKLKIPTKQMYACLRHALMGSPKGINMSDFVKIAGPERIRQLLENAIE